MSRGEARRLVALAGGAQLFVEQFQVSADELSESIGTVPARLEAYLPSDDDRDTDSVSPRDAARVRAFVTGALAHGRLTPNARPDIPGVLGLPIQAQSISIGHLQTRGGLVLAELTGGNISNGVMLAEGVIYKDVTFTNMQILIGSGIPYRFDGCTFIDCSFSVVGRIADSLQILVEMTAVTGVEALEGLLSSVLEEARRVAEKTQITVKHADAGEAGA